MERERKRKLAALMAALLHSEAEQAAAQSTATKPQEALVPSGAALAFAAPGPALWSLAGRRDHMDLRVMCQLRMGKSA